jgi:hypothetical protein
VLVEDIKINTQNVQHLVLTQKLKKILVFNLHFNVKISIYFYLLKIKMSNNDSSIFNFIYNNTKETKTVFDQSQIDKHIHDTFYTHLQDWEIFLRRKMNEKGMLLRDEVKAKITTNWDADDDDSAMME